MTVKEIPNSFTTYDLDETTLLQGSVLNHTQKMVLQNMLAQTATDKLSLHYNPENPTAFAAEDAYITGKLELLSYILDTSDAAEERLAELARDAAQGSE